MHPETVHPFVFVLGALYLIARLALQYRAAQRTERARKHSRFVNL